MIETLKRVTKILTLQEFEKLATEFKSAGYYMRGQRVASWQMQPSAYAKMIRHKKSWNDDAELVRNSLIALHFNQSPIALENYLFSLFCRRLCELAHFLIDYNYNLAIHAEKLNLYPKKTVRIREPSDWMTPQTFTQLFEYYFHGTTEFKDLNDKILKEPTFDESRTVYNEATAQHYKEPGPNEPNTPLIDCTKNHWIAVFFALHGLAYQGKKDEGYFAIYFIKINNELEDNPIRYILDVDNERLKLQEGLFIEIKRAHKFFLENGTWPSIENFETDELNPKNIHFNLYKLLLPYHLAEEAQQEVKKQGYTPELLLPPYVA